MSIKTEQIIKFKQKFTNDLENLKTQFFCGFNILQINWQKCLQDITWDQQKQFIDETFNSELNQLHPIKKSYQLAFLKKFIESLEADNVEIHDEIYERYCSLQATSIEENNFVFKHYLIPCFNVHITLKESKHFVSNGTTGLCSWQASLALSNWLLHNIDLIQEKTILELGAGTGLCSFTLLKCCDINEIIISDGSTKVVDLVKVNLNINCSSEITSHKDVSSNLSIYSLGNKKCQTLLFPWEDVEKLKLEDIISPDIILAADVIYDSSLFETLSKAIDHIFKLRRENCVLILAATVRNNDTLNEFMSCLGNLNFEINKQEDNLALKKYFFWDNSTPIEIYIITRNKTL